MLSEFHKQVEMKAGFEALFRCLEDYRLTAVVRTVVSQVMYLLRQ